MSVIIAVISSRDGAVASDGRIFGPASFDNERVTQPATIEQENFNKTFSLDSGKLIGAFAGLIRFSGKTVSEHISDIASPLFSHSRELQSLVAEIRTKLIQRLLTISPEEVIFSCRNLNLLLVAGMTLTRSDTRIVSMKFYPQNNTIVGEIEFVSAGSTLRYYVRGDAQACASAGTFLANNRAPNRDTAFLKKLATQAVQIGIKGAANHPYGSNAACGGGIFTQCTF